MSGSQQALKSLEVYALRNWNLECIKKRVKEKKKPYIFYHFPCCLPCGNYCLCIIQFLTQHNSIYCWSWYTNTTIAMRAVFYGPGDKTFLFVYYIARKVSSGCHLVHSIFVLCSSRPIFAIPVVVLKSWSNIALLFSLNCCVATST